MKLLVATSSVVLALLMAGQLPAQSPAGPVTREQSKGAASQPAVASDPEAVKQAQLILYQVHKTYKKTPNMTDSLKVEYKSGMGNNQAETLTFSFDHIGGQKMKAPGITFMEYAEKFHIVRDDVPDKYLVSDAKSISAGLREAFGDRNPVPPPVAFLVLSDIEGQLKSLSMGLITSPQLVGLETIKTDSGESLHEIRFAGAEGTGKALVTMNTTLLKSVVLDVKPAGAPEGMTLQVISTMDPQFVEKLPEPIIFDPGTRKAVKSMDDLQPTPMAMGEAVPDFTLSTLSGESVTLSKLQGSVVVLDFWATWCGPCKRALPELQKFSDWAAASGKPVKVFAVDVWEREQTPEAKTEKVKKFWDGAGYTMPTLMDLKDEVAKRYGFQSIPTTLVIGPDGKLFKMHMGYSPDMVKMLQTDVDEALAAK